VAVVVARRVELPRPLRVDAGVAAPRRVEVARADQLVVAVVAAELLAALAAVAPAAHVVVDEAARRGRDTVMRFAVGEAEALRPDAGVDDADDDVLTGAARAGELAPEPARLVDAEERRRVRRRRRAQFVFGDADDPGRGAQRGGLRFAQFRGEPVEGIAVLVDLAGATADARDGAVLALAEVARVAVDVRALRVDLAAELGPCRRPAGNTALVGDDRVIVHLHDVDGVARRRTLRLLCRKRARRCAGGRGERDDGEDDPDRVDPVVTEHAYSSATFLPRRAERGAHHQQRLHTKAILDRTLPFLRRLTAAAVVACCAFVSARAQLPADATLREADQWVEQTLAAMPLEDKISQLLVIGIESAYLPTESAVFERVAALVRDTRVGGIIVFGTGLTLGQPLAVASTLNRLQAVAAVPLLVAGDFESGPGMRLADATTFPRAMAFGAAGDDALVEEAARITAIEARAIGVHVNLAPVADVNSNARNPVISTRSFGESPLRVGRLVAAAVRGLQAHGVLATLKHFPGHGDTDVDSHLGLPVIAHARDRLDAVDLPPFRAGIAAGAAAAMTSHIVLPALEPATGVPATFSARIATGLLRDELGFDGLLFTDSMKMQGITQLADPGTAAARAVAAGHDMLLDVPDADAAFWGIAAAIDRGELPLERLDAAVRRILGAKARAGLHRQRTVDLDAVAGVVGRRAHREVAARAAERAITLLRDDAGRVPLRLPATASVLYLSVLDYPGGWMSPPSAAMLGELRRRWPGVTAIELSDRTPQAELDAVRESAGRYDAVIASIFVRTASGSGRVDLAAPLTALLNDVSPTASILFGNPYAAASLPKLRALLLAYDWSDVAERAAFRALAGDIPVTGRAPVTF
jgi:beta-glucosidase-like glycosyl hydrolase